MIEAHRQLPGAIFDVRYEALVANPEPVVESLLEFCGLPFDPACLRPEMTQRSVRTASRGQVRQPIYRTSVGRWRPYGRHLESLSTLLAAEIAAYEGQPD